MVGLCGFLCGYVVYLFGWCFNLSVFYGFWVLFCVCGDIVVVV